MLLLTQHTIPFVICMHLVYTLLFFTCIQLFSSNTTNMLIQFGWKVKFLPEEKMVTINDTYLDESSLDDKVFHSLRLGSPYFKPKSKNIILARHKRLLTLNYIDHFQQQEVIFQYTLKIVTKNSEAIHKEIPNIFTIKFINQK